MPAGAGRERLSPISFRAGAAWARSVEAAHAALKLAAMIVFHLSRGEGANTPFNFVLVAVSIFVFWGRRFRAPISPRLT